MERTSVGEYFVNELASILEMKIAFISKRESQNKEIDGMEIVSAYLKGRREMAQDLLEMVTNLTSKIEPNDTSKIIPPVGAVLLNVCHSQADDKYVLCEYNGKFVTWLCTRDGGVTVWGHYFDTYQDAFDDLKNRAGGDSADSEKY